MRPKVLALACALFVPVLVGLTASAALLADYLRPAAIFCGEGGGCEAVKHTALASPYGVPMPVFGVLGFAVLGVLLLSRGPRVRSLHRVASIAAAIVGVGLILAQLTIGQFCPWCLATDACACVACGVAIWRSRGGWDLEGPRALRGVVAAALIISPAVVLSFGLLAKAHLPDVIAEEMSKAPKGQATVVEFVDFECPFCRDEYEDLAPMLSAVKDRVRVVRKLVPLTRIHEHALEAARAACCGDLLGKGDAMADALFHAPVEDLTPEGCQKIAVALGLDPASYAACLADPKTAERLASDRQVFERAAAKGDGLPLLWIGERKIMGVREASELRRALDEAIAKAGVLIQKITDDRGRELLFAKAPRRVVSLVPSDTLTVAALGCAGALVGRTDYCVLPEELVATVPTVGGTKNPRLESILSLEPDLVLANQEENTKSDLETLAQSGIRVYVAFPKRVAEGIAHMAKLARVFGVESDAAAKELCKMGYDEIRAAEGARATRRAVRTFCPIWMDPLMTIHGHTFISDMLALAGAENVFADRERRYPLAADLGDATPRGVARTGARDVRYPRVTMEEVNARAPDLVLLPDEPHPFTEGDADVFRRESTPAAARGAVVRVDGKDLCWYGARSVEGLPRVRQIVARYAA